MDNYRTHHLSGVNNYHNGRFQHSDQVIAQVATQEIRRDY